MEPWKGEGPGKKNGDVQVLSLVFFCVTSNIEAGSLGVDEEQEGGGEKS